tara:strand:+ start:1349 stop:1510 length:162 start_codon:yes stop_codon:yes gene_type:complete
MLEIVAMQQDAMVQLSFSKQLDYLNEELNIASTLSAIEAVVAKVYYHALDTST